MPNRIKIAIADKNKLMRESLCEFLNLSGYRVTLEATGKNELLSDKNIDCAPDICLIQINYLEKHIEETIYQLRIKYPYVKVIVFSIGMKVNGVKLPKYGADESLAKSCSLSRLKELIDNLTLNRKNYSL